MIHAFDVEVATKYGLLEAILINHLWYWINKNEANEVNFHDGRYWTFNSIKAFSRLFPYISTKQIRTTLEHLREEGILMVANYNENRMNRALWYSFTDKGRAICSKRQIEAPEEANEGVANCPTGHADLPHRARTNALEGEYIYSSVDNTVDNTNIKESRKKSSGKARTPRPSLEEVKAYCLSRKNNVDPEQFIDFYQSVGWMVGKKPMKDWKAAVRTWERRNKETFRKNAPPQKPSSGGILDLNKLFRKESP